MQVVLPDCPVAEGAATYLDSLCSALPINAKPDIYGLDCPEPNLARTELQRLIFKSRR